MAVVSMRQMLEAGVHFGHQTRRWNPKMKQFIFGERNGIHIINLDQTLERIEVAYAFVRDLVANGGTVLFVGTKKQAQDPIRSYAEKTGMYYVNERWLGGMLTNFETISKRVSKMQEYERTITTVANSYVRPKVADYVKNLERKLKASMKDVKLHILRSDGGMASAKVAQSLDTPSSITGRGML